MRVFIGFDDTDASDSTYGTGKVVRWFQSRLPEGCRCQGVVRQQLLVCDDIPYTSHNSSACMVLEVSAPDLLTILVERAVQHIKIISRETDLPKPVITCHQINYPWISDI